MRVCGQCGSEWTDTFQGETCPDCGAELADGKPDWDPWEPSGQEPGGGQRPKRRGRWWFAAIVAVAVIAAIGILAVVLYAATNGSVTTTQNAPAADAVPVGTTLSFTTQDGTLWYVTLTQVVYPASASNPVAAPPVGDDYVALVFEVENRGSANSELDLGGDTVLEDAYGRSFSAAAVLLPLKECQFFGGSAFGLLNVGPGGKETGCIPFSVPQGDTLARVVVGGPGKSPGIWTIGAESTPTTTTPPTTVPATADVTITSCQPNQYDATIIDVTGTIVNHDTQADDYSIKVTLLSGSTRVGEADDDESNIASGQTSTWSTEGQTTGATGTVTCELGAVSRTPSS